MATEGADIVVADICAQLDTVPYGMATPGDLQQTADLVEALDRRASTRQVDARSQHQLDALVADAVTEFGGIDILVINHGIWTRQALWDLDEATWQDMIDTNLTGSGRRSRPPHHTRGSAAVASPRRATAWRPRPAPPTTRPRSAARSA